MLQFYLQLLIAGCLSITAVQLVSQFFIWSKFVIVGWRISKPPVEEGKAARPRSETGVIIELVYSEGAYWLGAAAFVFAMIRINLPALPNYMKAIISLSIAQVAYSLPVVCMSVRHTLEAVKGWGYYLAFFLAVLLIISVGTIICVPIFVILGIIGGWSLIQANRKGGKTMWFDQYRASQKSMQQSFEVLTSPKYLSYSDMVSFLALAGAYWLFGFRDNWGLFVAPAFLLVVANRMFSLLLIHMRKIDEPAQLRPFNPIALAGTLIILFSFYIAILLKHPEQTTAYLLSSLLFLSVLWYFCYLGRREATIEVGREAFESKDYDFQVDSANGMLTIFSLLVWFLQPVFLAIGLSHRADLSRGVYAGAWFDSMKVVLGMTLTYTLSCLFIWTRNIREPRLQVAGGKRPDYPKYRDNLAASALPYCVIIPALVYAFLNLIGLSPVKLPGLEGNVWIDIAIHAALMLILIGIFIQLPYRSGAKEWKSPTLERLEEQLEHIKNDIASRRENLLRSRSSVIAMKNISDELTLNRLENEIDSENKLKKLNYSITWPGELGRDSALYFVLSIIASAITTTIATNIDTITKLVLKIPK